MHEIWCKFTIETDPRICPGIFLIGLIEDHLIWFDQKELIFCNLIFCFIYYKAPFTGMNEMLDYVYDRFEDFQLLLDASYGTRYQDFDSHLAGVLVYSVARHEVCASECRRVTCLRVHTVAEEVKTLYAER